MMKKWKNQCASTEIIRNLYEIFRSGTEQKIIIASRNAYVSTDNVYKEMMRNGTKFMSVAFIAKLDKEKIIKFANGLKEKDPIIQKDCDWVIQHIEQIEKIKMQIFIVHHIYYILFVRFQNIMMKLIQKRNTIKMIGYYFVRYFIRNIYIKSMIPKLTL